MFSFLYIFLSFILYFIFSGTLSQLSAPEYFLFFIPRINSTFLQNFMGFLKWFKRNSNPLRFVQFHKRIFFRLFQTSFGLFKTVTHYTLLPGRFNTLPDFPRQTRNFGRSSKIPRDPSTYAQNSCTLMQNLQHFTHVEESS